MQAVLVAEIASQIEFDNVFIRFENMMLDLLKLKLMHILPTKDA